MSTGDIFYRFDLGVLFFTDAVRLVLPTSTNTHGGLDYYSIPPPHHLETPLHCPTNTSLHCHQGRVVSSTHAPTKRILLCLGPGDAWKSLGVPVHASVRHETNSFCHCNSLPVHKKFSLGRKDGFCKYNWLQEELAILPV